jgi:hypothetical protein
VAATGSPEPRQSFITGFWIAGRAKAWAAAISVAKDGGPLIADDTAGTICPSPKRGKKTRRHAERFALAVRPSRGLRFSLVATLQLTLEGTP